MSTKTEELLIALQKSREYRAEFVAAHAKHSIALQIHDLMEQQDLTQSELAKSSDLSQATVSRALDINYGNLAVNTLVRMAAGFDVAFVCGFVPFSRFLRWVDEASDKRHIDTFAEEFGPDEATTTPSIPPVSR